MNHIEVLLEYKYMQKKPDPGLNYTELLLLHKNFTPSHVHTAILYAVTGIFFFIYQECAAASTRCEISFSHGGLRMRLVFIGIYMLDSGKICSILIFAHFQSHRLMLLMQLHIKTQRSTCNLLIDVYTFREADSENQGRE